MAGSAGLSCPLNFVFQGPMVRVDVPRETLNQRFGVDDTPHGLLIAYEAHRDAIDAAVLQRAVDGGTGMVVVRPKDIVH